MFAQKSGRSVCKNLTNFVLQQARKDGHLQVPRLRIYYHATQAKTTLISTEELLVLGVVNDLLFVSAATENLSNFHKPNNHFLGSNVPNVPPENVPNVVSKREVRFQKQKIEGSKASKEKHSRKGQERCFRGER